jgi:hypothetical protein
MGKHFIDPKISEILSIFPCTCTTQIALFWPKLLPALFKKPWYPCTFEILEEALCFVPFFRKIQMPISPGSWPRYSSPPVAADSVSSSSVSHAMSFWKSLEVNMVGSWAFVSHHTFTISWYLCSGVVIDQLLLVPSGGDSGPRGPARNKHCSVMTSGSNFVS